MGTFRREFTAGTEVIFSAPDRVGNLRFEGFAEVSPDPPSAGAARAGLPVIASHNEPARTGLPSAIDGQRHMVTLALDQNRKIEARYVPVAPLELRIGTAEAAGEVPLVLDGERYTPYRLEQAETTVGPWETISEGLVLEPKLFPASSTTKKERFFRAVPDP